MNYKVFLFLFIFTLSTTRLAQCTSTLYTIAIEYNDDQSTRSPELLETFDTLVNALTTLLIEAKNPDFHVAIQRNDLALNIEMKGENIDEIYAQIVYFILEYNKMLLTLKNQYEEALFRTHTTEKNGSFLLIIMPTGKQTVGVMKPFMHTLARWSSSMQKTLDNTICSLSDKTENAAEAMYSGFDKTGKLITRATNKAGNFAKETAQKTKKIAQSTPQALRNTANVINQRTQSALEATGDAWEKAIEAMYSGFEKAGEVIATPFTRSH